MIEKIILNFVKLQLFYIMAEIGLSSDLLGCKTPAEIISCYVDRNRITESGITKVRGIYEKSDDSDSFRQWFFDKLIDETSRASLKILIGKNLRDYLVSGDTVEMIGTISDYPFVDNGLLQVQMRVIRCEQAKELFVSKIENDKYRLRRNKLSEGYRDVTRILTDLVDSKKKPRIVLVYPSQTVADTDLNNALGEAKDYFLFEKRNVPFSNPEEVVRVLDECDRNNCYDLVCLVRGGGSGLQNIDDIEVLSKVVKMKTPVLTALGHADDQLFINSIADMSKDTPTALGTYFRKVAEDRMRLNKLFSDMEQRYDLMVLEKKKLLRIIRDFVIFFFLAVIVVLFLILKK